LDGQNLSGQLSDWSINDLLQIMQVTKKTGSLDIAGERRGRVHFREGAVTGAELSGAKGSYRGTDRGAIADILYVLSTVEAGTFAVGPADGPDSEGLSVEEITREVEALRSLEGEVIDAGLFEAPGVRLLRDVNEAITLDPEDWQVLVTLVQPFTFDFLESRVGRGGAVRIFHTLHRLGVAEAIAGDDESEWLDKLAGGLTTQTEPTWLEQVPEENGAKHVAAAEPEPEPMPEPVAAPVEEPAPQPEPVAAEPEPEPVPPPQPAGIRGVSAPASTTLTDGVYDEIRRLRSKVSEK
jgi:Domain of unknown function (DUF4388)